mmetsp:Transcript_52292/g.63018  ORF Transcript_52292/g.63018 Transcript_52292/m.63018 type:complete len:155 (-) Transcript_52292:293-757(-)
MENKQASSTGPSLRACLRNDCSTIGVTVVHNVIVRKQTEPSLRACLEGSTISVTVKPSLSCCLDGHGSFISKNETSLGLANAKKNSINEDIDALGTVTCVSPEHRRNKKRKKREVRTIKKVVSSQTKLCHITNSINVHNTTWRLIKRIFRLLDF